MPVKNIVTNQKVTAQKLQRAKELRREMTPAEKILWEELRGSKAGSPLSEAAGYTGIHCRLLLSQVRVGY